MSLSFAFIGAGGIHFGSKEGPWDHASRLETIPNLRCSAIVDADVSRASSVLLARKNKLGVPQDLYANTQIFSTLTEMLEQVNQSQLQVDMAFIGLPPDRHGGLEAPLDVELRLVQSGIDIFVEKPLSTRPPEEVALVAKKLEESTRVVAVGYMLRYHAFFKRAKELFQHHNCRILCISARYNCGYSPVTKREWWDTRASGGPIVEQATHFIDAARYFGGEADMATVQAVDVPAFELPNLEEAPKGLDGLPVESHIPEEFRIPRATCAIWRFLNGSIATLQHSLLLHTGRFRAELELLGDGLQVTIVDPYESDAYLQVRLPHTSNYSVEKFDASNDMYLAELSTFVNAVCQRRGIDQLARGYFTNILSPYSDSVRTYELSWHIRRQSERNRKVPTAT